MGLQHVGRQVSGERNRRRLSQAATSHQISGVTKNNDSRSEQRSQTQMMINKNNINLQAGISMSQNNQAPLGAHINSKVRTGNTQRDRSEDYSLRQM